MAAEQSAFRDAVKSATDKPVFFVDKKEFTDDRDHNFGVIARQYKEQFPNERGLDLADPNDRSIAESILRSADRFTNFAVKVSDNKSFVGDKCIVGEAGADFQTKQQIVSAVSGIGEKHLKNLPGTDSDYQEFFGLHEGEHCNQPVKGDNPNGPLTGEIGADDAAYAALAIKGKDGVVDTMRKAREAGSLSDKTHATHLNAGNLRDNMNQAETLKIAIGIIFLEKSGIETDKELEDFKKEAPQLYVDTLQSFIDQGLFDNQKDSSLRDNAQKHVDAHKALLAPQEEKPQTPSSTPTTPVQTAPATFVAPPPST